MYCSKCGTKVADDDYACYMCGARLRNNVRSALDIMREEEQRQASGLSAISADADYARSTEDTEEVYQLAEDPIEATVREMFANRAAQFAAEDNEDLEYIQTILEEKPDKRSGNRAVMIILAVLAVLIIAVSGAYLLLKDNGEEAEDPVQIGKDEEVSEVIAVPEREEPQEEIKVSMIGRARELRDDYLGEKISYDEAAEELKLIADQMYDDADEYDEITDQIDRINDSRSAFDKGERQFERGEYADAIISYKEVLEEDDKYYKQAGDNIVKCNDAVKEQLTGRWTYVYDARSEVQAYVKEKGFDIDISKMKVPVTFVFDLKENGDVDVSVDRAALNEYIDRILDLAVETMSKGIGMQGESGEQVSDLLKYMYGATGIKEKVKKELNIEQALDNIIKESGIDQISSYNVDDAKLYLNNTCMDVKVDGSTLTLTSDEKDALPVGKYEMPFPIKMERRGTSGGETEKNNNE